MPQSPLGQIPPNSAPAGIGPLVFQHNVNPMAAASLLAQSKFNANSECLILFFLFYYSY